MPEPTLAGLSAPGLHLHVARTGLTVFQRTGWSHIQAKSWALDYLHAGYQRQRLGDGEPFDRQSRVAALYAPGARYHEYQVDGESIDESWVTFDADPELAAELLPLVGERGWCHFRDPEELLGNRLRRLGELLLHRPPGYRLLAPAIVLELLALLTVAAPFGEGRRAIQPLPGETTGSDRLPDRVARYIRAHLAEPLQVADLAVVVGMSLSAFAHAYPPEAGESPYRTIMRIKLAEAKRLLLQRGLSVKETAAELGFSSEFALSRAFKRQEGLAPTAYVQAMRRR